MYVNEEVLHYAVAFLSRYEIENQSHKEAVKQFRQISDYLIEHLYKPSNINVIRKTKPEN
jgi:hypothetical protein